MAGRFQLLQRLRRPRLPLFLHASSPKPFFSHPSPPLSALSRLLPFHTPPGPTATPWGAARSFSHGTVNLVLSGGTPKFETHEAEPPKKDKWKTKKRLKLQRKREKRKRKDANRRDPRRVGPKGKKKHKFPDAESRIKYKLEMAKTKEAMLVEKLKRYEVPKLQGPIVKPEILTGEERFYMQKMAQKQSNYVPVGRRGVFGGVILNMHLHWKKHETVEVICKPCKPGQVKEYARDIARLSGGTPIKIIGDDTIIFYRGKNYVQPEVMSPVDTLSKKKALEKSKYEQSLETVRRFIAISEKELELYYRHVALYGDPNSRNSDLVYGDQKKSPSKLEAGKSHSLEMESCHSISDVVSTDLFVSADQSDEGNLTGDEADSAFEDLTEPEIDSDVTEVEVDSEYEELSEMEVDKKDEKTAQSFTVTAA